jgi:hypothetical protein
MAKKLTASDSLFQGFGNRDKTPGANGFQRRGRGIFVETHHHNFPSSQERHISLRRGSIPFDEWFYKESAPDGACLFS